jgi:PIN domain nuclease of toxin-antitoxin system
MSKVVLDASAILAIISGEAGQEKLTPDLLSNAVASTVNLAEVQAKLVSRGWSPDDAWEDATSPVREAIPFSEEHAKLAGSLVSDTQHLGLSLGDRACLSLGMALTAPVFTAERAWKKLKLTVRVHAIR